MLTRISDWAWVDLDTVSSAEWKWWDDWDLYEEALDPDDPENEMPQKWALSLCTDGGTVVVADAYIATICQRLAIEVVPAPEVPNEID